MRYIVAVLLTLGTVGSTVACDAVGAGGDGERLTKETYLDTLESMGRELETAVTASVDSNFASPSAEELAVLEADLADEAEQIRPPLEVEDAHTQLVAGLRESAAELRELATIIEESKTLEPIDAIVKLSESGEESTKLAQAARELERRGYQVPQIFGASLKE